MNCRLLACSASALVVLTVASAATAEITVQNWQRYGTEEAYTTATFEARIGSRVVHDDFNAEQEMLTKLRLNPGLQDVVVSNGAITEQATEEGLLAAIDTMAIGNFHDLVPTLRDSDLLNADLRQTWSSVHEDRERNRLCLKASARLRGATARA